MILVKRGSNHQKTQRKDVSVQQQQQQQPPRQSPDASRRNRGRSVEAAAPAKGAAGKTAPPAKKSYDRPQRRRKPQEVQQFRGARGSLKKKKNRETEPKKKNIEKLPLIHIPDTPLPVSELAAKLDASGAEVVKHMMMKLGVLASVTQSVEAATARKVVEDFGREWSADASLTKEEADQDLQDENVYVLAQQAGLEEDDPSLLETRPPVVTVMGHVDHGKTSLLDAIRETSVASGETGGITQGIGAYQVSVGEKKITFLDTPGHAAFSEMRARGANCTDIVVLVVAADDGVKEQTVDSIGCAKVAQVPLIVAVNKMDTETADPDRVYGELAGYEVVAEDFGGEVLSSKVSAIKKEGINDLLEKILLQSEILDLRANAQAAMASGVIVEAHLEKGLGVVATTLVRRGTLRVGDPFAAGVGYGRVRVLLDDCGNSVDSAGPSTPVKVVGWQSAVRIPKAGDEFVVAPDEQSARKVADAREAIAADARAAQLRDATRRDFSSFIAGAASGDIARERRSVTVLIKADTAGSVVALTQALEQIDVQDDVSTVKADVVYSGVGDVTKSDIAIAAVSGATILAFNVGANKDAIDELNRVAAARGVNVKYYGVIYDAINDVEAAMRVVLSPTPEGELVGTATIKQIFDINKLGKVAGCGVTDGYLRRGAKFRVMQGDRIKLADGRLRTLRNLKVDVERIQEGSDCGLSFKDWDDFEVGDLIECYDAPA